MSQQKNSTIHVNLVCKECNTPFSGYRTAKFCSESCSSASKKQAQITKGLERSKLLFPDTADTNSYISCALCGYRTTDLAQHPQVHGLSQEQYRKQYGDIKCKNLRDKMKGSGNPGYQHGGKLSPFSKKFVNYTSDKDIASLKEQAVKTKVLNNSNPLTLTYYTAKGYTKEEAEQLIVNRQTTFSLDKCIEKHGEEAGKAIWQQRQDKWMAAMNSKTDEEIAKINKKKIYRNGMSSKQEKQLVEMIRNAGVDIETQHIIKRQDIKNRYYSYDIFYNNKIIEYNGDIWHANPTKYKEGDVPKFPSNEKTSAEIWDKDKTKLETAAANGYSVLVIWESDFKSDKQKVIKECIDFLTA